MPDAASQRVTNAELKQAIAELHQEVMNVPHTIGVRLERIEGRQEGFGVELTAVRQKMGQLEEYQRVANGCMGQMKTEIEVLKDHDKQHTEARKAQEAHWWDVVKIPLGIGIGAVLTWIASGGLNIP